MSANLTLADSVLARLQPAPFWDHLGCVLLDAVATVRRRGARAAVIDVEVTASGQLVALGRTVFAVMAAG